MMPEAELRRRILLALVHEFERLSPARQRMVLDIIAQVVEEAHRDKQNEQLH